MNDVIHINTRNKNMIIFDDQEIDIHPKKYEFYNTVLGFRNLPTKKNDYINVVDSVKKEHPSAKIKTFSRAWLVIRNFSPVLDRILIDVDSEDLQNSLETTRNIVNDLKEYREYINIYFSGSKGFHIEINTEPLDIIDTTTDRAGDSCLKYKWFLNYFKDKYDEVDTSISDGTRLFRKHHSVNKKTSKYKVLVDITADLDTIIDNSQKDNDMVEKKPVMDSKTALEILATYSKPQHKNSTYKNTRNISILINNVDSYSVEELMDKLYEIAKSDGTTTHDYVNLLGFCCTNFLNDKQIIEFAKDVASNTDSQNAYESCIDAYYNNKSPDDSLGGLYRKLKLYLGYKPEELPDGFKSIADWSAEYRVRKFLFDEFKSFLKCTRLKTNYPKFKKLLREYNNDLPAIYQDYLLNYIKNDDILAIEVLYCFMVGLGFDGVILKINSKAGSGKTVNKKTLFSLIPNGNDLGKITPAAVYRLDRKDYNRKVIYTNDKGLEKGQQKDLADEARSIFRELSTDLVIKKTISDPHRGVFKFDISVDSTALIITDIYNIDDGDRMGNQMGRVTVNIDIEAINKNELIDVMYLTQDPEKQKAVENFTQIHSDYFEYLLMTSNTEIQIPKSIYSAIAEPFDDIDDATAIKRAVSLYKSYCIFFDVDPADIENVKAYREFFGEVKKIGKNEMALFKHLEKYMTPFDTSMDLSQSVSIKDSHKNNVGLLVAGIPVSEFENFELNTRVGKKNSDGNYINRKGNPIHFITVSSAKSYLQIWRNGRVLDGYKDNAGDLLYTLERKGFLDCIHTKGGEKYYYIPKKD